MATKEKATFKVKIPCLDVLGEPKERKLSDGTIKSSYPRQEFELEVTRFASAEEFVKSYAKEEDFLAAIHNAMDAEIQNALTDLRDGLPETIAKEQAENLRKTLGEKAQKISDAIVNIPIPAESVRESVKKDAEAFTNEFNAGTLDFANPDVQSRMMEMLKRLAK